MTQLQLPYDQFVEEAVGGINSRYEKAERSLYDLANYVKAKVEEGVGYGKSKEQVYRDMSSHESFKLKPHTLKSYDLTAGFLTGRSTDLPISTVQRIAESRLGDEDKITILGIAEDKQMTQKEVRNEIKTLQREQKHDRPVPPLPEDEYNIVYADPPWRYDFAETSSREIENQYPTMELEDIKMLNVPSADNSVLLLWATAPKLKEAFAVMESWGFTYKTCAVWDKEKIGMGYWFRGQHELLLVGTKGACSPPLPENRFSSVIREARTQHSKKPAIVQDMIEQMFPNGKYLELFCRVPRQGWAAWGNEI